MERVAYIWKVDSLVLLDVLSDLVNLVGDILRSGTTVGSVELNTKVVVGSTRVVRGGKEDTTVSLERADEGRDSWGGDNGVLSDDNVLDTVGSTDAEDDLSSLWRL